VKTLLRQFITATAALGLALSTQSQSPIKQPVALRTVVGDVSDYRTTAEFNSQCTVELKFIGDATAEATDVLRVQVKKAEDNLNRNLILEKNVNHFAIGGTEPKKGPLRQNVYLRNPSRNATSIKVLEGEVELFVPTLTNGGLVVINDLATKPPAPIQNPILKKHGIDVMFLTKDTFQSKKSELSRYTSIVGSGWPYSKTVARVYVRDPNHLVKTMDVQYPDGTSLATQTPSYVGETRVIDLSALPASEIRLVITAIPSEAKRTFSFKLENIPLP
jgi:hypothetical protein